MQRLAHAFTTAVTIFAFCAAAGAATLTIESNATTYGIGDTITITITGDSEGEIAPDDGIRVIVAHELSKVSAIGVIDYPSAFTQFDGAVPALSLNEGVCFWALGRDNQCKAFEQLVSASGFPVDAGPRMVVISYTAEAAGIASFMFQDAIAGDFVFFSLGNPADVGTAPAGISVTIVPEPGTGLLVLCGLLGLARRRRGPA